MSLPVVCCVVVPLFVLLAPWSAGGGDREDMALSYVYADSALRVCGSPLAVCLVSLLCLCVARACRHHLSSVHPYRVGVQSEPGCSSPFYLPTYLGSVPAQSSRSIGFLMLVGSSLTLCGIICNNNDMLSPGFLRYDPSKSNYGLHW